MSPKSKALKNKTDLPDSRDEHGNKFSHIAARSRLEKKDPSSKGHLGVSKKGVYRHNPKTGFNEKIDHRKGKFTGKDAY